MERDPFVLTGLMWAWLEQLKEPVISIQEAKTLDPDNSDAQTVLNTLDQVSAYSHIESHKKKTTMNYTLHIVKHYISNFTLILISFQAPKETLTCILECMAQMLRIPEEVEDAFLNRTIKAFTWVRKQIHLIIWDSFQQFHLFCHYWICYNNLRVMFAFE